MVWAGRLQECRELVRQQLDAVGGILENMAGNLDTGCAYLEPMQDALLFACKKAGIRIQEIVVTEVNGSRGKKVVLCVKRCNGRGICKERYCHWSKKLLVGIWYSKIQIYVIWQVVFVQWYLKKNLCML